MVLNAAVQMLREAEEVKQKILKFQVGTSMLQERSLWALQQELQKVYQKVLVLDLDYALEKKVEQDLWNVGFKQQIEALQAISKDKKNPLRSEGQAMLSWVLQAAAGFYLCLLHQICTTFKLDLPFRRRASLLGLVEGWAPPAAGAPAHPSVPHPAPAAARYAAQHCLVHLGDLARYRQQLRVAHTFYRHALAVSPHSGQPYNQLALVAWRRARRLAALYWHARSLLVRTPFPPAPANLARTLRAAHSECNNLPVLPGLSAPAPASTPAEPRRLDAHSYTGEFIRALHLIYSHDDLDAATKLVEELNSSLTALVATDSFESMTLIKMAVVIMWLVDWSTERLSVPLSGLAPAEALAAQLSQTLAAGAVLALLLPAYTATVPPEAALPPLYVWLQWVSLHAAALGVSLTARPQLGPALAHALNALRPQAHTDDTYDTSPLPEDTELYGFLPLAGAHAALNFPDHAAWDAPPKTDRPLRPPSEMTSLESDVALSKKVRARRLILLGRALADARPDMITASEDNLPTFTSSALGSEQLTEALAALSLARAEKADGGEAEAESESDSEVEPAPPPTVISEADFREKVREKRVGILKPQGSLERAREERAAATTGAGPLDEEEVAEGAAEAAQREALRKPRTNVAMAAILRKQEEVNKQVKFVSPPPTPDSAAEGSDIAGKGEKPKAVQPKAIKSLDNLPVGVKTGGILCLKDKSGYPHLVNTDPEPKKAEKEEKRDPKPSYPTHSQNTQYPKPPPTNWGPPAPTYEPPRLNFQNKNVYGIQNTGLNYNPNYQGTNPGIRLPVVNPKEIDVRTAALQKQNSRQDFQDGRQQYLTGDKKNFLNDLPPRFANQYRYWQGQDGAMSQDNKFRDDNFTAGNMFNQQRNWPNQQETFQQPMPYWKADTPTYSNPNFSAQPMNVQPNYFSNVHQSAPYQNMPYAQQNKSESHMPSYLQPQMTLQNLVTSPNFNSSHFGYQPPAYDAAMYPQFGKSFQPTDKGQFGNELIDVSGLGFGGPLATRGAGYPPPDANMHNMERGPEISSTGGPNEPAAGSTYSLFSGAPQGTWGPRPQQQSLWSGPGPSPLERLLEQQRQLKPSEPH